MNRSRHLPRGIAAACCVLFVVERQLEHHRLVVAVVLALLGPVVETVLERGAQLEAEQDLRAEDQHARLVEPDFDLLRQFHRAVPPQLRVER